jgi:GTPase
LGVLTRSRLDDGRGKARVSLFRHKHEIETGRTSSAGNEILGFQPDGKVIVPEDHAKQQATWESIAHKAAKVVSFTDLAGHEKYLKVCCSSLVIPLLSSDG